MPLMTNPDSGETIDVVDESVEAFEQVGWVQGDGSDIKPKRSRKKDTADADAGSTSA